MIKNFSFEEAFEKAKSEAIKKNRLYESSTNKLIVSDVVSYEFGWFFYFANFKHILSIREEKTNNDLQYFSVCPVFIDRFDGESIDLYLRFDYSRNVYFSDLEVVENYFNNKYLDYWKNKRVKEDALKKEDEELDEWIKQQG